MAHKGLVDVGGFFREALPTGIDCQADQARALVDARFVVDLDVVVDTPTSCTQN